MMEYLAVQQKTASWLLGKPALVESLARDLPDLARDAGLKRGVVVIGPLRASATQSGTLLALWNVDYLSGTGAEHWGVIKLAEPYGLLNEQEILHEVFQRTLQITDRRLQGFFLDPAWRIRHELPGVTTCIAGSGKAWQDFRLAYVEGEGTSDHSVVKGVLLSGPAWEDNAFRSATLREQNTLGALLPQANSLLSDSTKRPTLEHGRLRTATLLSSAVSISDEVASGVPVSLPPMETVAADRTYETLGWSYDDWVAHESQLTGTQRTVLNADILEHQPVRIVGAAGSGKTLLMMLLAIRQLRKAARLQAELSIVYIAHNSAMRDKARARLLELGADPFMDPKQKQRLHVLTLFDYARDGLGISDILLIDRDADASKRYQREIVREVANRVLGASPERTDDSPLLRQVSANSELFEPFVDLLVDEISVAIKGQGMTLSSDPRQYVDSEKRLSRLHGIMHPAERQLVWQIFAAYQDDIASHHGLLDADDLALSLLGRLRTPLWELRRSQEGYDYVFVDEAQLFNENEKRLFPLIAKRRPYVPMVIALDQAQQSRALTSAGLGALGIDDVRNETLQSVHRCSAPILKLAFYVIQQTTDLFGDEFPDFTRDTVSKRAGEDPPRFESAATESSPEAAARVVGRLRQSNRRQIAVVCFASRYWNTLRDELNKLDAPLKILEGRGEQLPPRTQPLVALSRPDAIGGQEFDAVVCVGLEQGVVPLVVHENESLSSALEQQALREMYLAFTRARTELVIVAGRGATLNGVLQRAVDQGILEK